MIYSFSFDLPVVMLFWFVFLLLVGGAFDWFEKKEIFADGFVAIQTWIIPAKPQPDAEAECRAVKTLHSSLWYTCQTNGTFY